MVAAVNWSAEIVFCRKVAEEVECPVSVVAHPRVVRNKMLIVD